MKKGCLIGKGRTAEVYEWDQDKVLKLYFDWFPIDWIKHEADIGEKIHNAGVPSPTIYEIIEESRRNGLLFEWIKGESMLKFIEDKPWKIVYYAKKMARLSAEIHKGRTSQLPLQKDIIENAIRQSEPLLDDNTEKIVKYLHSLPDGESICHGDLHPDNIIISDKDTIAIDWSNAYVGNPLGDVARTCLLLRTPFIPSEISTTMTIVFKLAKRLIDSAYLKEYLKLTGIGYKDIDAWILPIAAARLQEKVPAEEKWLLDIINKKLRTI